MAKKKKKKNKKRDRSDQVTSSSTDITAKAKHKKKSKKFKSNDPSLSSSSKQQQSSTSLAQLLKRHRGVAADTAPPPIWKDTRTNKSSSSFLSPKDNPQAFKECLQTSYAGFHYDKPEALPSSLHSQFDSSFGGMDKGGLFLYDVVQPGKKRLTRTSVTRCLVGDPGSTYKYLGLRLFSHPWTDVDSNGNSIQHTMTGSSLKKLGYSDKTTSALISMGCINSTLTKRSKAMLQEFVSPHVNPVGSADYNLTLVNKMESIATKKDLKQENTYGMGKTSVGWHRDSGLRDFSSIAVYQSLKDTPPNESHPWAVALRAMDGGSGGVLNDVPPLVVPLPSGSLYYMLDDFNHNHEHAVIAGGDGIRYSSTHRVAREGAGTWQYIRDKVQSFLSTMEQYDMEKGIAKDSDSSTPDQSSRKRSEKKLISHVRAQQNLLTEIEFEWIRQFYVQGKKHASLHPYWHDPIKILTESFGELEEAASKLLNLLSSSSQGMSHVTEDLYDVLIEAYSERSRLCSMWIERYKDPIFDNIPEDERPIPCPYLGKVEDTDKVVSQLRQWRSTFVDKSSDDPHDMKRNPKSKKKLKKGSLTKKESKARSSNWERLKATMK